MKKNNSGENKFCPHVHTLACLTLSLFSTVTLAHNLCRVLYKHNIKKFLTSLTVCCDVLLSLWNSIQFIIAL